MTTLNMDASISSADDSQTIITNSIAPKDLLEAESDPCLGTTQRFALLDLPLELQRLVFYQYFGGFYDITLEHERLSMLRSRFHVLGIPPLDLVLTSKYIHAHAAPIRHSLFTGRLILNSVFILVPLRRQERFLWLREHTRILHFSDSSVHPERWSTYFGALQSLGRLEIVFPSVIRPRLKRATPSRRSKISAWSVEDVLSGKKEVDEWLIGTLDEFRLTLLNQLREGHLEVVVTQRYGLGITDEEEKFVVSACNSTRILLLNSSSSSRY